MKMRELIERRIPDVGMTDSVPGGYEISKWKDGSHGGMKQYVVTARNDKGKYVSKLIVSEVDDGKYSWELWCQECKKVVAKGKRTYSRLPAAKNIGMENLRELLRAGPDDFKPIVP